MDFSHPAKPAPLEKRSIPTLYECGVVTSNPEAPFHRGGGALCDRHHGLLAGAVDRSKNLQIVAVRAKASPGRITKLPTSSRHSIGREASMRLMLLHLLLTTACLAQQERSEPLPFDVSHHALLKW